MTEFEREFEMKMAWFVGALAGISLILAILSIFFVECGMTNIATSGNVKVTVIMTIVYGIIALYLRHEAKN